MTAGEPAMKDGEDGEANRGKPASTGTGEVSGSGAGAGGAGAPEDIDDEPAGGGGRMPPVSGSDTERK